ncbi:MAG: LysM domain-containing protein [Anaerolineae bacterium]|nr:LysM domain-containing protein [Anaerolineae bacterium]
MKALAWVALGVLLIGGTVVSAQVDTPIAECSIEEQQQVRTLIRATVDDLQELLTEFSAIDRDVDLQRLRSERMALLLQIEALQTRWWDEIAPQMPACSEAIAVTTRMGRIVDELLISSSLMQVILQANLSQLDTMRLLGERLQERNTRLLEAIQGVRSLGIGLDVATPTQAPVLVVTVVVIVTATPDLNATIPVRIVTATPQPGESRTTPPGTSTGTPMPTILEASESFAETATALPEFCLPHILKEGDTPFGIAEMYQADPFRLLEVNGLDEASTAFLQVGDVLIVPLDGCPLGLPVTGAPTEDALTPTPALTPSAAAVATITPTITLAPTAANAVIRIVEVLNVGDVTAEAMTIRNTGQITNIANWTLSDDDGNTYTFAEQRLFTNAQITLYTRIGTNSPVALYWGRDQAVFEPGDVITLRDAAGAVQATYRVPG